MTETEIKNLFESIYDALEKGNTEPLIASLADDVDWMVDWKGEGIFGGGSLFGRYPCSGSAEVQQFFSKLFSLFKIEKFKANDYVIQDGEAIVLGWVRWLPLSGDDPFESDWTMRWVIVNDKVVKCRFMTLPKNHIKTFIEDEENYQRYTSPQAIQDIVKKYQKLYFDSYLFGKTWVETYWMGYPIFKCPLDLWVYQEMMFKLKPDIVIETGTNYGGSALYLAQMCDLVGNGKIISIDITDHYGAGNRPQHDRIVYLLGSSTSDEIINKIRELIPADSTVLVILDSDHHKDHVLEELRRYHPFVSKGSYLIVEDSNLNGNPVKQNFGPGPREAIEEFFKENSDFRVDREMEKFYMTFNPGGYLLKLR